MRHAFRRFRAPGGNSDVDVEELPNILMHLGYFGASEDIVFEIAKQVNDFSTFGFHDFVEVTEKFVAYERERLRESFETHASEKVLCVKDDEQVPSICLERERFLSCETPT